jgi:predicted RNA-binding Zn ribbon-like protein
LLFGGFNWYGGPAMSPDNANLRQVPPKHEFLAGRISLDYCNTLSRTPNDPDRAQTPRDFVSWARRSGIDLDRRPSAQLLKRLHDLRAALFGIFEAVVEERAPAAADLSILNTELADARTAERLVPTAESFVLADSAPATVDRFRHTIARDAADLLTADLRRIKRCPNHDCLWLFRDGSKNLSRRWCAMSDCGGRDKVRRFRGKAHSDSAHRTRDRAVDQAS